MLYITGHVLLRIAHGPSLLAAFIMQCRFLVVIVVAAAAVGCRCCDAIDIAAVKFVSFFVVMWL
jgi:hypothetical protein